MRVESVWNARTIMSNMSWMWSGKLPGMPVGVSTVGIRCVFEPFGLLDPPLDFADAGQVFVELLLVASAELLLEAACVVEHEIEDRPLLLSPQRQVLAPLCRRTGAEEPLEDEPRVRLGRDRQGGPAPRQIVLIGARVARVARTRLANGVARELERRKPGQMTDSLRRPPGRPRCRRECRRRRSSSPARRSGTSRWPGHDRPARRGRRWR